MDDADCIADVPLSAGKILAVQPTFVDPACISLSMVSTTFFTSWLFSV